MLKVNIEYNVGHEKSRFHQYLLLIALKINQKFLKKRTLKKKEI